MSKVSSLNEALHWFAVLDAGEDTKGTLRLMQVNLNDAGVGYEALDPTGQKTGDEMAAVVKEKTKQGYLGEARYRFKVLGISEDTKGTLHMLQACLKAAGVGYEALDPTGKMSAAQIKTEMRERTKQGYIGEARNWFEGLGVDKDNSYIFQMLRTKLREAGVGYEALDPTGKKSAAEIETLVRKRAMAGESGTSKTRLRPLGVYNGLWTPSADI